MRRGAFRPSVVFLSIVALFGTGGVLAWLGYGNVGFDVFLFVVGGWLTSLCVHEYAHALTAYRGGDTSVAERGYLTLNPLKYSHPVLSIGLPVLFVILGGIGMPGGAVSVERHLLRGRGWDSAVSAAGPAMNVLFAIVLLAPFAVGVPTDGREIFWAGVAFLAFLQVTAALLNLLPIPGVDGGNLIYPWLPGDFRRLYEKAAPFGLLLLFALMFTPQINQYFFGVVYLFVDSAGLPAQLTSQGYDLFTFWN